MARVSKKTIYRASVAILSVVMVLVFTGCSKGNTDVSNEISKISSEDSSVEISNDEILSEVMSSEETSNEEASNEPTSNEESSSEESSSEESSSEESSSEESSSEESSSEESSSEESSSEESSSEESSSEESSSEESSSEESSSEESSNEELSSEELSSEESLSEELSEEAKKINQEIIQEFPDLDFAYALYDIQNEQTVVKYNTQKLFPMGDTEKAAYCFWIYKSGIYEEDKEKCITLTQADYTLEGKSHIRDALGTKYNYGDQLTVATLLELTICVSDNISFNMLTRTYGHNEFNNFMQVHKISIKLEESDIPLSNVENQMKLWILIEEYLNKVPTSPFGETLFVTIRNAGLKSCCSMTGWEINSGTVNECYIIKDKYIAVLLTSTGKATTEISQINTSPLKLIAKQLDMFWETYYE